MLPVENAKYSRCGLFGSGIPAEGSGIRRVLTPLPERLNSGTA